MMLQYLHWGCNLCNAVWPTLVIMEWERYYMVIEYIN